VTQDCAAGADPKCTVVDIGPAATPSPTPRCVPLTGTVGEGGACTRTDVGHDNCNLGQFCTSLGTTLGDRHCRRLCHSDGDCVSPEKCAGFLQNVGVCVRSCTPFSSDCTGGLSCADIYLDADGVNNFAACRSVGASSGSCTASTDCVANTVCGATLSVPGSNACNSLCDNAHACTGGLPFCQPITGLPNGGGTCLF
jgi:hypothetical protein